MHGTQLSHPPQGCCERKWNETPSISKLAASCFLIAAVRGSSLRKRVSCLLFALVFPGRKVSVPFDLLLPRRSPKCSYFLFSESPRWQQNTPPSWAPLLLTCGSAGRPSITLHLRVGDLSLSTFDILSQLILWSRCYLVYGRKFSRIGLDTNTHSPFPVWQPKLSRDIASFPPGW